MGIGIAVVLAIIVFADELNRRPRRKFAYRKPEELFEAFLDGVYAT